MKLWILTYLFVYSLVWLGGMYDSYRSRRRFFSVFPESISGLIVFSFVLAYLYKEIEKLVATVLLPMLILGLVLDVYSAVQDVRKRKDDNNLLVTFAVFLVTFVSVPGYYIGFSIFFRNYTLNQLPY